MPIIQDRIDALMKYLAGLLPLQRRTVFNPRALPASLAATLDVDRVHEIITGAEQGDTERLFQLYMEVLLTGSHLQGRLADRKEAVLSDTLSVQPFDKNNADDVAAAELIKAEIAQHDDFEDACAHLLDSVLWPVALVEKTFRPSQRPGLRYELASLTAVPAQLLTYIEGEMQLRETDGRGYATAVRFAPEPTRYLIHRGHLLKSVPDNWGGPMRSILFWWLLGHMSRDWWARFLDRYGSPFVVGRYDQGDDDSRLVLERAFALATKLGGLVVTKETEVEIKQAAASDSGDAYKSFIELCNREISKLVLGETLSSDAQSTGLNSGNAQAQAGKRDEKRAGDARRLAKTLRAGLCDVVIGYAQGDEMVQNTNHYYTSAYGIVTRRDSPLAKADEAKLAGAQAAVDLLQRAIGGKLGTGSVGITAVGSTDAWCRQICNRIRGCLPDEIYDLGFRLRGTQFNGGSHGFQAARGHGRV